MIARDDITGLVLAGGRGSRMGGVDKGLALYDGEPLALRALRRLAPQVGRVMINANRHVERYAAMGVPVWPDTLDAFPGPLAGMLVGLEQCRSRYLVTVPCDAPHFPLDLVARLSRALERDDADVVDVATAATRQGTALRTQPVFSLMATALLDSLCRFVASGERKVDAWLAQQRRVEVAFDDLEAFANANTADELRRLQRHG